MVTPLEAVFERAGQTEEFHGDQLLVGLFIQHVKAPESGFQRLRFRIGQFSRGRGFSCGCDGVHDR
jgi:hypothetical protein